MSHKTSIPFDVASSSSLNDSFCRISGSETPEQFIVDEYDNGETAELYDGMIQPITPPEGWDDEDFLVVCNGHNSLTSQTSSLQSWVLRGQEQVTSPSLFDSDQTRLDNVHEDVKKASRVAHEQSLLLNGIRVGAQSTSALKTSNCDRMPQAEIGHCKSESLTHQPGPRPQNANLEDEVGQLDKSKLHKLVVENMNKTLLSLRNQLEAANSELDKLRKELAEKTECYEEKEAAVSYKIGIIQQQLSVLEGEKKRLNSVVDQMKINEAEESKQNRKLKEELKKAQEESFVISDRLRESEKFRREQQGELNNILNENHELQKNVRFLQRANETLTCCIRNMESKQELEVKHQQKLEEDLKNTVKQSLIHSKKLEENEMELKQIEELDNTMDEKNELQNKLEFLQRENETLSCCIKNMENKQELEWKQQLKLKEELENSVKQNWIHTKKLEENEMELKRAMEEKEGLLEKLKSYDSLVNTNNDLRRLESNLHAQLEQLKSEKARSIREYGDLKAMFDSYESDTSKKLKDANADIAKHIDNINVLKEKLQILEDSKLKLISEMTDLKTNGHNQDEEIKELREDLTFWKEDAIGKKAQVGSLTEQNNGITIQLEKLTEAAVVAERDREQNEITIKELRAELSLSITCVDAYRAENCEREVERKDLVKKISALEEESKNLREEVLEDKKRINDLNDELRKSYSSNTALKSEIADWEKKYQAQAEELIISENKVITAMNESKLLSDESSDIKKQLENLKKEAEQDREQNEKTIKKLREDLRRTNSSYSHNLTINSELRNERDELQKKLDSFEESTIQYQISQIRVLIHNLHQRLGANNSLKYKERSDIRCDIQLLENAEQRYSSLHKVVKEMDELRKIAHHAMQQNALVKKENTDEGPRKAQPTENLTKQRSTTRPIAEQLKAL